METTKPAPPLTIILVLGMHRAGTSVLTRAVSLVGAGLPRTLMPPAPANPGGFWESAAIAAFNDAVLEGGGSSWSDWRGFSPGQLADDERAGVRLQIVRLLAAEFGEHRLPVLKDPRLCRLLRIWLPVLEELETRPRALLALRHPAATIRSLCKRDGVTPAHAALLWLRHMLDAERETRHLPRAMVSYNALLGDWQAALRRAGRDLGLDWPIDPSAVNERFVDERGPDDEAELPLGSAYGEVWCRHAWQGLRAIEAGDASGMQTLDRVRGQFEDACALYAPAVATRSRTARAAMRRVTIVAADCARVDLTLRALTRSARDCDAADTVLFSDRSATGGVRVERIARLADRDAYSTFMVKGLAGRIASSHALVVQWDGFVVEPSGWLPDFLDYDYVGARWAWHPAGSDVGNGGFSLRSRRLLEALADPGFVPRAGVPEDELICRSWRGRLEREFGIRFAPAELADAFSYERRLPRRPTFGFHGLFNLWRHADDRELAEIAVLLPRDVMEGREFSELIALCFAHGRADAVGALGAAWRSVVPEARIEAALAGVMTGPEAEVCARMVRTG